MVTQGKVSPDEMQRFYDATDEVGLAPGWLGRGEEHPEVVPFLWKWSEVEPLVLRSGEAVTPDRDVQRRVLRLAKPWAGSRHHPHHINCPATPASRRVRPSPPAHTHGHPVGPAGRGSVHHRRGRQALHGARGFDPHAVVDLARPQ